MDHSDQYFKKYLKYKEKYRLLKESIGGNRYDRFGRQEQNMQSQKKMSSKELFRHDFEKWKVTYPQDYKRWLNKLRTTNPSRYLELMSQDNNKSIQKSNQQARQLQEQKRRQEEAIRQEKLNRQRELEQVRAREAQRQNQPESGYYNQYQPRGPDRDFR
jgi:hypothetical protein|tara:strand:+ start:3532 stop:4008 length:477 start_codon:yes stop_codon:yes gene_type:complete